MPSLIEASNICKEYHLGNSSIRVLNKLTLSVDKGEFIAIAGASGSGKSTLLHIIGCLDRPTSGSYFLSGQSVISLSDRELSKIRADNVGFVFQTFNLLPHLNVFENIEFSFLYSSHSLDSTTMKEKILHALDKTGLLHRLSHRPSELSGGEMQRVAIARAICKEPEVVLADEPTGNLDSDTGTGILKIFQQLHNAGTTLIMVTHNKAISAYAQRTITLKDGRLIHQG
ncbi:MAG: ABC transporter ATP-binding protein [Nitrospirota bacterium]